MATNPTRRTLAEPKVPVQERSIDKVERVLDAAESLVLELGTAGVTMQMISQRSGVGRASVYQFFPSILAVWKGLALRYLAELQEAFERDVLPENYDAWPDAWDALIDSAVAYYNENPAAQRVLLGTDEGHDIRIADPEYDKHYAEWIADQYRDLIDDARAADVRFLRVSVTAVTAVFTLSVWEHGAITPAYATEAKRISRGYMQQLIADLRDGIADR